jgi:hypothetical protein
MNILSRAECKLNVKPPINWLESEEGRTSKWLKATEPTQ